MIAAGAAAALRRTHLALAKDVQAQPAVGPGLLPRVLPPPELAAGARPPQPPAGAVEHEPEVLVDAPHRVVLEALVRVVAEARGQAVLGDHALLHQRRDLHVAAVKRG